MLNRIRWSLASLLLVSLFPAVALAAPLAQRGPDKPTAEAGEGERGVFVERCHFSHSAADDPIVHPGRPGASHQHDFFGNTTTNAGSTLEALRAGPTTCLTPEDASGYWVPALYQNGAVVPPLTAAIYYRTGRSGDPTAVQPFPPGFRMVAGDPSAVAQQTPGIATWKCRGGLGRSETPLACPAHAPLVMAVRFPECWDGASIDSPDHKSHVAYARGGRCPASHPVPVPALTMNVRYPIAGDPGEIRLASGSAYSGHADFFNAWDQSVLAQRIEECLHETVRCGARQLRRS
jgi:hypothetical protein